MEFYKVLTHDLRPPIWGGDPIITGPLPFQLPEVNCNQSEEKYSFGWNACKTPEDALRISGIWPNGRPSRLFRLMDPDGIVERGTCCRARSWTIVEEIDVRPAIETLSHRWFGDLAMPMIEEQMAWREALNRPFWSVDTVEAGLCAALEARKLDWVLKRFYSVQDILTTRNAWVAWNIWAARNAWAVKDAWVIWDAKNARIARVAWDIWDAKNDRNVSAAKKAWDAFFFWDVKDIWDVRDAKNDRNAWNTWACENASVALTVDFVGRNGWINISPDRLTVGLRDAYRAGLAIAISTGPNELGWVMVNAPKMKGTES